MGFNYYRVGVIVGVLLAVGCFLYFINPTAYWFTPKCPFKLMTGLDCPACGIQRFIHTLLHGEFARAIQYNYYLGYTLPYISLFGVAWVMREGAAKRKLTAIIEHRYAVGFYVVSFFVWLIVRNILHI